MDKFWKDMSRQLDSYYDGFIALIPWALVAIVLLMVFYFFSRNLRNIVKNRLNKRTNDPLLADFVGQLAGYIVMGIGILMALKTIGLGGIAASLMAGAGVSAFIIGFAFKDIGENFLAGILMAFERPFRIGDIVQVAGVEGRIVGMSLRDIQIKTFDGKDVFVPNGLILRQPIFNSTVDGFLRYQFPVRIQYNSETDIQRAKELIIEELSSIPGILKEEHTPNVVITEIAGDKMVLEVHFWIDSFGEGESGLETKSTAMKAVTERLQREGYQLPG